jgi:hypothetical protein
MVTSVNRHLRSRPPPNDTEPNTQSIKWHDTASVAERDAFEPQLLVNFVRLQLAVEGDLACHAADPTARP